MAGKFFTLSIILLLAICLISITACGKKKVEETPAEIQETEYIEPVEEEVEETELVEETFVIEEEPELTEEEILQQLNTRRVLEDVFFAFDKYDLSPMATDSLLRNAEWLKQNPTAAILIEGHCDERGTSEYNLALGDRRAQSTKNYLTSLGIAAHRIETISYGEEKPSALGQNEGAWSQNRRAHFVITSP